MRSNMLALEQLPAAERNRRKLAELRSFIRLLTATDSGLLEMEQRRRQFGECEQAADESDWNFYGRLRVWLDRSLAESPQA
ncbi:MAG: hypothetical protein QM775_14245 [Pirellulales bacterium]